MIERCPTCGKPIEPRAGRRLDVADATALGYDDPKRFVWAEKAIASSHWGSGSGWGPIRATGPPRIFPRAGDEVGAWAPADKRGGYQWITLDFPDVPPADAILVFETCGAGAVVCAHLGGAFGSEPPKSIALWSGDPAPKAEAPRVLFIPVSPPRSVHNVTLWLDTDAVEGYNEIDAVAIRVLEPPGPPTGGPAGRARRVGPDAMAARGWAHDRHLSWAKNARASSEWGSGASWGATKAVGPPAVYPRSGDRAGSWSPASQEMGPQWIWLDFGAHCVAEAVYVFETCGPGAVFCVEEAVETNAGGYRHAPDDRVLWRDEPQLVEGGGPSVLVVEVDPPRPLRYLRLWLDTSAVPGYNQIDAVALRSTEPEHEAPVAWDARSSDALPLGPRWRRWLIGLLVLLTAVAFAYVALR